MPTPVGPVAPDPNDPDLWSEWYDDEEEADGGGGWEPSRYGWPLRLLALLAIVAIVALLVI